MPQPYVTFEERRCDSITYSIRRRSIDAEARCTVDPLGRHAGGEMTTPIRFGTEGWRAIIGQQYTEENVARVAQATALFWLAEKSRGVRVGVGFDTRFGSERIAILVTEILTANGLHVLLADRATPTPAISALVVHAQLDGAVMVTASHNPAHFNGIKVKAADGGSIDGEAVTRIESLIDTQPVQRMTLADAQRAHQVETINPQVGHLAGIRKFVDMKTVRAASLRVVVDSMHGTGGQLMEQLLSKSRARVTTLHGAPDPLFGGHAPEPIARYLPELLAITKQRNAHIGLAMDGDADRIGGARPDGKFLNPGQIMCLILEHLVKERGMRGGVVTTISNISWIPLLVEELGLPLHEVPVGFKNIAALMRTDDIVIGGEESGGIGVTQYLPERDGVLLGMLLLEVLAVQRKPLLKILADLERRYGRFAYGRVDLHFDAQMRGTLMKRLSSEPPTKIAGKAIKAVKTYDGLKIIGHGGEWVLFRLSGTEPIMRIYAEAPTMVMMRKLLAWGQTLAKP
jgi:phosphomannomutase